MNEIKKPKILGCCLVAVKVEMINEDNTRIHPEYH